MFAPSPSTPLRSAGPSSEKLRFASSDNKMNSLMLSAPYKYKGMWVFDVRLCDHWQFGREPFYQRVAGAIVAAAAIIAIVVSLRNQVVKTEQAEKALDES